MARFDYGRDCSRQRPEVPACNREAYGSDAPPAYNLSRIATPLALFTGGKDRLADPLDVEYLVEALPPGVVAWRQDEPEYEHLDFTWGVDAAQRMYPTVLRLLAGVPSAS